MERRQFGEGTIRLHENGLWEGRLLIRKNGYKPYFKYAYEKTYEECEKKLKELKIEYEVIDNELFNPNMLFREWVEIWLVYTASKRNSETLKSYKSALDNHILPALGDRQISKITTGVLERFYADLRKDGRLVHRELYGTGLSVNMVRTIHKLITAVFATAVEHGFLRNNPGTKAKIPATYQASKRIFSSNELKKILEASKEFEAYELVLFALCTAVDRGELCALRWQDITLSRNEVRIYQTLRYDNKSYILTPVLKASQNRKIMLSNRLVKILRDYKKKTNSQWIFPGVFGNGEKPRNPDTITTLFQKILKKAGVEGGSFKTLRDTYAVICLDNGMDIRTLSSILGFQNVKTAKSSYEKYTTVKKVVAANKMEGAMTSINTLYS